jgi:hypothetical protein
MKRSRQSTTILAAVTRIVTGAAGYANWRNSRTSTLEMNIGDETLRIEKVGESPSGGVMMHHGNTPIKWSHCGAALALLSH